MFNRKNINFHFAKTNEPCTLYFYTENGILLAKKNKTKNPLNFCLTTCLNKLCIIAHFNNKSETLCLSLSNCICQKICITFESSVIYRQNFILFDRNYHFPIKKAVLNFLKKAL